MTKRSASWFLFAAVIVLTVLAYLRTLEYGQVNWDNQLSGTSSYQESPELDTFRSILTPTFSGTYQPVRGIVMALLAPFGAHDNWLPYHLFSLGFYLATILILFLTGVNLFGRIGADWAFEQRLLAATAATAVFALHPGHVEVVAWVSGQKDVLVGFFYILSFYFYSRRDEPSVMDLGLTLLCFFLALGSKPSAVSLPLVLVAYDWLFRRQVTGPAYTPARLTVYALLFIPAIATGIYFFFTTARIGSIFGDPGDLPVKAGKVCAAFVFSFVKILLPVNLCLRYPEFRFTGSGDPMIYFHLAAAAALIVWTARALARGKPAAFFLFWFLAALLPNANLVQIVIERADRYYYLSSIGVCLLAGYGLARLYALAAGERKKVAGLAMAVPLLLALLTWQQAACWSDAIVAWKKVFALYPEMTLSRIGLGHSYLRAGDYDNALRTYKPLLERQRPNTEAILGAVDVSLHKKDRQMALDLLKLGRSLDPKNGDYLKVLSGMLIEDDEFAAAEQVIGDWLKYYPQSPEGYGALANLRRKEGKKEAAEANFRRAIDSQPNKPEYYNALAVLLADSGRVREAESLLQKALETGVRTRTTRLNLAAVYAGHGRDQEALVIYSRYPLEELDMKGLEFMGAHYFGRGQPELAIRCFQTMSRRDSTMARAFNNQAVVYENLGSFRPADSLYLRAISLQPDYVDAHFNRGNLLKAAGDLDGALIHYRLADSLAGGSDPAVRQSLAAVYDALGDSAAAVRVRLRLPGKYE